jgi:hypothetical protein
MGVATSVHFEKAAPVSKHSVGLGVGTLVYPPLRSMHSVGEEQNEADRVFAALRRIYRGRHSLRLA